MTVTAYVSPFPEVQTCVRSEKTLVRPRRPFRQIEAVHLLHVTLHSGKVEGVSKDILRRHKQNLSARVLQNELPLLRALLNGIVQRDWAREDDSAAGGKERRESKWEG